eukprot:TRINITY_DN2587_c0_g1_i2.p1 TRINITY_DN2587_c0_g1~~TRINITY_DN2587_c0_g1_i2.p1  ORF type:complete len:500 (+),score=114.43 TRINITY_DN2587_c0_g1_i2:90-1502(+)
MATWESQRHAAYGSARAPSSSQRFKTAPPQPTGPWAAQYSAPPGSYRASGSVGGSYRPLRPPGSPVKSTGSRRRHRDHQQDGYLSSGSEGSPLADVPDACPDDLACARVNDPEHQARWRHSCRLVPCDYLWMAEHRRLFSHSRAPPSPHSPGASPKRPGRSPIRVRSVRVQSAARHGDPHAYRRPPPGTAPPPPVRPPPRLVGDPQVFAAREPDLSVRCTARPPPAGARPDGRQWAWAPPPASPVQQPRQGAVHASAAGAAELYYGCTEAAPPPAPALADYDAAMRRRLNGFALLKELEALCMEVRTLRHLHHYRHSLARQHSVHTVAMQTDHSLRRVAAAVRRVRRLQAELPADDILHGRADDEVGFAEELIASIDDPQAAHRPCAVPAAHLAPIADGSPSIGRQATSASYGRHDLVRELPLTPDVQQQPPQPQAAHPPRGGIVSVGEDGTEVLLQQDAGPRPVVSTVY